MFASISKLFRKAGRDRAAESSSSPASSASGGVARPAGDGDHGGQIEQAGEAIGISYATILKVIPQNLHGKNASAQAASGKFFIPRQEVIDQLSHGAIRIAFGSFRTAAPAGTFTTSAAQDATLIDLPLADIVPQLKQSFVRHPKTRVEVPAEVADVFGAKGAPLSAVRVLAKQEVNRMTPASVPTPIPAPARSPDEGIIPVAGSSTSFEKTPELEEETPIPAPKIALSSNALANLKEAQAAAKPAARPAAPAAGPSMAAIPLPVPTPVAAASPQAHATASPGVPPPRIEGAALVVALCHLSDSWPDEVQREIKVGKLSTANCHLPLSELGKGLKQGKIELPWKTVRAWLKPAPPGPSLHGEKIVALPLQAIAPMFLAQGSGATPKRKTDLASKKDSSAIPDVFSSGLPAGPAPAVTPPAAVPPPTVRAPAPPAPVVQAVPAAPAEKKPAPPANLSGTTVPISISLLAANWPQNLVKDLDQKFLSKAKLEIPVELLEPGIRSGKVDFAWTELCSWMQPPPSEELAAAHAETRLGLPLSVVAPLFLQRKGAPARKKSSNAAEEIPDLFYQGDGSEPPLPAAFTPPPAPPPATQVTTVRSESVPASVTAPAAAPAPAVADGGPRKREKDLAELFGQPDKRNWTPNEIVQKTAQLPGVSGALIALQDGLLVASCMPPEWRTETVAAFLPQIFGRMHQYTKELRMGELHSVTFAVDAGAMQIYAAGIIYFATLSKPESPLPLHELNLIARELSRHTK
jgi:predicted regulator of Ras-like GTPase activity (Roadblock/LC7/MglB family)